MAGMLLLCSHGLHLTAETPMVRKTCLLMTMLLPFLGGCTLNAPGKPTLATTTSAEETQRLFWENVKTQKWQVLPGLMVANVTWRNGHEVLAKDGVVPYLQQLKVKDYLITNVVVKANANEMTVRYDLQLTTEGSTQPVNLQAVAVWQQLPAPSPEASKKEKKQAANSAPYLLTVEDLVPMS